MDDGSPELEVGFSITTAGAFAEIERFEHLFDDKTREIIKHIAAVEKATGGMVRVSAATAEIKAFANAATRELAEVARATGKAEKAGEAMVRQLERQNAAFGQTREELRGVKAEAAALAAEQQGLTELATRIRATEGSLYDKELAAARALRFETEALAQEREQAAHQAAAAAERESQSIREAAHAYALFEAAARRGSQATREAEAAADADAAASERLRISTDPLYAATKRLNDEIAESARLFNIGVTAAPEYARQQEVLTGRLNDVRIAHDAVGVATGNVGGTAKLAAHHTQNLAFQFQDLGVQMFAAAGSSAPLKMAFTAMIQQGTQIAGIMAQAGIGIRGVAAAFGTMAKAALLATVTNPILLGVAAAIGAVYSAYKLLDTSITASNGMDAYTKSVGLTKDELAKLGDTGLTVGDVMRGVWKTFDDATGASKLMSGLGDTISSAFWKALDAAKTAMANVYGAHVAAYEAIVATWRMWPAAIGDLFFQGVNAAIGAINALLKKAVDSVNSFGSLVNKAVGHEIVGALGAAGIAAVSNPFDGAAAKAGSAAGKALRSGFIKGVGDFNSFGKTLYDNIAGANSKRNKAAIADLLAARSSKGGAGDADKVSDQEKALIAATKAARDYAAAQQDAAAKVGLSAKELRLFADAAALAAAVKANVAAADIQAIRDGAAAREKAYSAQAVKDFDKNVLQPLRDELQLYGLVGPARDAAALALEKQSFLAKNGDDGPEIALQRWQAYYDAKRALIDRDDAAEREAAAIRRAAEELDALIAVSERAGDAFARAFGRGGAAIADALHILTQYSEQRRAIDVQVSKGEKTEAKATREKRSLELATYGDLTEAAKSYFSEKSKIYKALSVAEKVFRAIELASSIKAIAQDTIETGVSLAKSAARTAAHAVEAVAKALASLPPPANFVAAAGVVAALAAIGVSIAGSFGGNKNTLPESNTGTGTILGDPAAKSESINRSLDQLRQIDTLLLTNSRQMLTALRSIDSQIGGAASLIAQAGNVNASAGVATGFKTDTTGKVLSSIVDPTGLLSKIPVIGGVFSAVKSFIGSLFGSKTSVIGSGLYGGAQSLGSIVNGGFDASYYSDLEKKKRFLGVTTGKSYSTQYTAADSGLENQMTLILRSFNSALAAAAGPLGVATKEIESRLNGFIVNIGKIDLAGLTGEEIQTKLTNVFGAVADNLASAAFPEVVKFQRAGEGLFETAIRISSTVETVTASIAQLGSATAGLGIDAKVALADQFDSLSDFASAAGGYFEAYFSPAEQNAARLAQLSGVFVSMNLALPDTLAGFRALVEAQDLNTEAGRAAYTTLLQLAPAFADLKSSMDGAKSAADILAERQDLQRKLLELAGDTAAIRALDLVKLDASNRGLQMQVWAVQDAQDAAKAAQTLADAWTSVGTSIGDEIKRIRGLSSTGNDSFAALQGQFNVTTDAARGGDIDAAKLLPGLSQSLLKAAADAATSRQELARVQAMTAASLEATNAAITAANAARLAMAGQTVPAAPFGSTVTSSSLLAAASVSQAAAPTPAANDDLISELAALREEVKQMRADNNSGNAAIAGEAGRTNRTLDNLTLANGGDALTVRVA